MRRPLVSILIPTYNRIQYLRAAVASACEQSFRDIEIVVYDDGSRDSTPEWAEKVRDSRVRYERDDTNRGIGVARNRLLSLARGEYVTWLDSDDVCNRYRVEMLLQAMRKWMPPFVRSAWQILNYIPPTTWRKPPEIIHAKRHTPTTALFPRADAPRYMEDIDCGGEDVLWEMELTKREGTGILIPFALYYVRRGSYKGHTARRITKWGNMKDEETIARVAASQALRGPRREALMNEIAAMGINPKCRVERVPARALDLPYKLSEPDLAKGDLPKIHIEAREETSKRCEEHWYERRSG